MKKYIKNILQMFFVVNTGCIIGSATFITLLQDNASIEVKLLWQILLVSLVIAVSTIIFCSKDEISNKELIIRTVIHYMIVNLILIVSANMFKWIEIMDISKTMGLMVIIFLIYVLIFVITYEHDLREVKKINQKIEEYNTRELNDE